MRFQKTLMSGLIIAAFGLSACIMTKDPKYQQVSSYLDARYEQILYLNTQHRLTSADYDEAYLLSTMYREKNQLQEAKNLLKIVFDNKKTLTSGVDYVDVLNQLGEKKEADDVHKFLTVLYAENEIQDQTNASHAE